MEPLKDPLFLQSLPEPLKSFGLAAVSGDNPSVIMLDKLEANLRQEILKRLGNSENNVGEFWKDTTRMCWHMVYVAENENAENHEKYKDLSAVRKLPILLLEDILDSTTLNNALEFYKSHAVTMFPLLFDQLLWRPDQKTRPCWLPFLKLANKFTKRLNAQQPYHLKYKDAVSSLMLTLCEIYPLSEKSATRVWGSYNDHAVTTFEGREEFEQEQVPVLEFMSSASPSNDDDEEDGAIPDYTVYESFWKLQQDLSRPNSIQFSEFLQRLRSLLTTLEHTPVPNKNSPASTDPSIRIAASTSRYLTSSRLLSIQLQDADFRIPVLTQVLVVCHHLIQISPVVLKAQLSEWQNRANTLLQNVSPEQHELLQTILITSEESWRQWKRNKCSPDLDQRKSEPLVGRKRKSLAANSSLSGRDDSEEMAARKDLLSADLPKVSKRMRKEAPSMQSHLEEYIEALDPESGIEAEYHPKNNALFCWRAMRLLSSNHLSDLHLLNKNGDFERVVRTVYARDHATEIPGDMPEEDEVFKEEEEDEDEGGTKIKEDDVKDSEMEDADPSRNQDGQEEGKSVQEHSPVEHDNIVRESNQKEESNRKADEVSEQVFSRLKSEIIDDQDGEEEGEYRKEKDEEGPPMKDTVMEHSAAEDPTASSSPKKDDIEEISMPQQRYVDIPAETSLQQLRSDYTQLSRPSEAAVDQRDNIQDPSMGRDDETRSSRGPSARLSGGDRSGDNPDRFARDRSSGSGGRPNARDDHKLNRDEGVRTASGGVGRSSDDRVAKSRNSQNHDDRSNAARGNPHHDDSTNFRRDERDRGARPSSRGGGEERLPSRQRDEENRGGGAWKDGPQQGDMRSSNYVARGGNSGQAERSSDHRPTQRPLSADRFTADDRTWTGDRRSGDRGSSDNRDRRGGRGDRRGGDDNNNSGGGGGGNRNDWRGGDRSRGRSGHRDRRRH